MSTNGQRDAPEEPACKTPHLARPPPTEERQVSQQAPQRQVSVRLIGRGYAGHRPGLTIRFNAEWIQLPQKNQATQTDNVTDPDVPDVPPMATTGTQATGITC